MGIVAKSIRVAVDESTEVQVCAANRSRVGLVLRAVDGNAFLGGPDFDHSTLNGMRLLEGERHQVEGPSAEAELKGCSGIVGTIQLEGLEFIVEP